MINSKSLSHLGLIFLARGRLMAKDAIHLKWYMVFVNLFPIKILLSASPCGAAVPIYNVTSIRLLEFGSTANRLHWSIALAECCGASQCTLKPSSRVTSLQWLKANSHRHTTWQDDSRWIKQSNEKKGDAQKVSLKQLWGNREDTARGLQGDSKGTTRGLGLNPDPSWVIR